MAPMIFKKTSLLCRREYGLGIKEAITSWRDNGFSQKYISDRLGVSAQTVRSWANRFGIEFNRSSYNSICRGGTAGMTWAGRRA